MSLPVEQGTNLSLLAGSPRQQRSYQAMAYQKRRSISSLQNSRTKSNTAPSSADNGTTVSQSLFHLFKGYIGPGMLSLPWAISQLGIPVGFFAVFAMSSWSSYNCWTVVRAKRHMEAKQQISLKENDDMVSEEGSIVSENTNITYPDVGEWAYGRSFQSYVRWVKDSINHALP